MHVRAESQVIIVMKRPYRCCYRVVTSNFKKQKDTYASKAVFPYLEMIQGIIFPSKLMIFAQTLRWDDKEGGEGGGSRFEETGTVTTG